MTFVENHIWKTKKEKIIDYVRHDPFLKIEEIAEKADTTPRYVRTILSEANISLMKLRKEYALDIEKRSSRKGKLLLSYILNVPFENNIQQLKNSVIFNNPNDFKILKGDINKNYIHQSYKHIHGSNIWCLNTLSLEREYIIENNDDKDNKNINNYIHLPDKMNNKIIEIITENSLTTSDITLGVEAVNNQVGEILGLKTFTPIFKVKQKIYSKNKPVILNIAHFHPGKIKLSLSSKRGITIRRKVV